MPSPFQNLKQRSSPTNRKWFQAGLGRVVIQVRRPSLLSRGTKAAFYVRSSRVGEVNRVPRIARASAGCWAERQLSDR